MGIIHTPLRSNHLPRSRVMRMSGPRVCLAAVEPSSTITFGRTRANCIRRCSLQASASASSGTRLFGGRHLTMLQIYTRSLGREMAASIRVSS